MANQRRCKAKRSLGARKLQIALSDYIFTHQIGLAFVNANSGVRRWYGVIIMKRLIALLLCITALNVFAGGTTYNKIGDTIYGSDGSTSTRIGNHTYNSNGSTSMDIGNHRYNSDGSSSTTIGNTRYNSDGSSSTRIGDTIYGSDGSNCSKIGNTVYCN